MVTNVTVHARICVNNCTKVVTIVYAINRYCNRDKTLNAYNPLQSWHELLHNNTNWIVKTTYFSDFCRNHSCTVWPEQGFIIVIIIVKIILCGWALDLIHTTWQRSTPCYCDTKWTVHIMEIVNYFLSLVLLQWHISVTQNRYNIHSSMTLQPQWLL